MDQDMNVENEEKKVEEAMASNEDGAEAADTNLTEEVSELDSLKNELEEMKKKHLYLAAEFENSKRRLQREKENLAKFGTEKVLSDILPVIDNLERTMNAIQSDDDSKIKNIFTGVKMVHGQFLTNLSNHGLEQIESLGQEFDPNLHEAMGQEDSEEHESNTVINIFENGYKLNGRLIRAAKVIVSK